MSEEHDVPLTSFGAPLDAALPPSPSQTVGPFLHIALDWPDGPDVVPQGTPDAVTVGGLLLDGAGDPVNDGLVETWQADPRGRFDHPDDPRGPVRPEIAGFRGFGRSTTSAAGHWQVRTVRPGPLPTPEGGTEAPHLDVTVMARGMLDRVVTRIYFEDDADAQR
jgi:protocatechuate 3,4-dioxygenase alpha subunit